MKREFHVHSVQTRTERIRTAVEIVAILAAGLWALYTFVYEQRIKPLSEQPEFSAPTTVVQGPTVNGVVFLSIHRRLENTGNVPIDIAAEALNVYGEKVSKSGRHIESSFTPTSIDIQADVPLKPVALLLSRVRLRSGAVDGNPHISFYVPPHSTNEEDFQVAVPAHAYAALRVDRIDYIRKAPINPKIPVHIKRALLGAYTLGSPQTEGEYDSENDFPIAP